MPLSLTDQFPQRRAFITGAASGLGFAFCRLLADDGWTLGMADIDQDGLANATSRIREHGGVPHPVKLDVSDAAAFQKAADAFVSEAGGVDLVVNNAGLGAGGAFRDTTIDDWNRVISVNLMGVVHGCHAFLPHLEARGGHLMNIASIAAVASAPRMSIYNATKASVKALSETLYGEYKERGVHVSVVMPSFFETNIDRDLVGTESARSMTQMLMSRSGLSAAEVAEHALEEAASEEIHVIYPSWMSRLIWYGKRLLPGRYVRSLVKREQEAARFADKSAAPS